MTTSKHPGVQRCIYMPKQLDEQLRSYLKDTGLPASYVIKTALKEFFALREIKNYST